MQFCWIIALMSLNIMEILISLNLFVIIIKFCTKAQKIYVENEKYVGNLKKLDKTQLALPTY